MAGRQVQIIPKSAFKLQTPDTFTQEIILAQNVDTLDWTSGVLLTRVIANSIAGTGAQAEIYVRNVMWAPDEPGVIYTVSTPIATCTMGVNTTAATLLVANLTTPISRWVQVVLKWTPTTATPGDVAPQNFTLAVDLVGRTG